MLQSQSIVFWSYSGYVDTIESKVFLFVWMKSISEESNPYWWVNLESWCLEPVFFSCFSTLSRVVLRTVAKLDDIFYSSYFCNFSVLCCGISIFENIKCLDSNSQFCKPWNTITVYLWESWIRNSQLTGCIINWISSCSQSVHNMFCSWYLLLLQ